ncbi:ly6/PLAUR domain-containing protein 2-like isoform X2 [Ahaetulla prasina]|nr:ly6/PLAUR domain-containing protein 2-like isoform X2 [Ahaetulla prasina]XP_058031633.1 ly6/PLAUR domain-containing protein 2-like isoform X2 [Ahaetulla prasina]
MKTNLPVVLLTIILHIKKVPSLECYICNQTSYSRCSRIKNCSHDEVFCTSYTAQCLRCFSCREPTRPEKCMTVTNCMPNQTMCMTTMHSLEEVYPFVGELTVTRACSLTCNLSEIDEIGSTRLMTCCRTELCNHDGASWLEISYTLLGGILASFFLVLS